MASYPIFRTLIGHSDTFSGNAFETVQMGRDNLLLPFQGRNDSFCQRMVRSRLGGKQYIFIMLLLPLRTQPANSRRMPYCQRPGLVDYHHIQASRQSFGSGQPYHTRTSHHQHGQSGKQTV